MLCCLQQQQWRRRTQTPKKPSFLLLPDASLLRSFSWLLLGFWVLAIFLHSDRYAQSRSRITIMSALPALYIYHDYACRCIYPARACIQSDDKVTSSPLPSRGQEGGQEQRRNRVICRLCRFTKYRGFRPLVVEKPRDFVSQLHEILHLFLLHISHPHRDQG